ncbi:MULTISPECIES: hypothetical protein [unclassified Mesorhizobium]|uniref:hypothetical protein n=1 Tax=Mesorhizobium sp. M1252 TaxID=2957073 RepID=UPI0003CFB6E5|nr:hypothetical protein [Mesorhizobium sp. L2C054A000]ESZ49116.1 hypothetical protein X731_08940 [Mesorhizobium sp. L2C054A000]
MTNLQRTIGQCVGGIILIAMLAWAGTYAGAVIAAFSMGIFGGLGVLIAAIGLIAGVSGCLLYSRSRADRSGFMLALSSS